MSNHPDVPRLEADDLRRQAAGRWLEIFQYTCPGMFDHAIAKLGTHVTCPFHGGAEDFRFVKKSQKGTTAETGVAMCTCGIFTDGFAVIRQARGLKFHEVLEEVNEYLNGGRSASALVPRAQPVAPKAQKEDPTEKAQIEAKNAKLWGTGKEMVFSITPYYLSRGITPEALVGLKDVRVADSVPYFNSETITVDGRKKDKLVRVGNFPTILAMMRSKLNEPVAIHRTWLSRDRKSKAPVVKAKKLTETTGAAGAAIQLHDALGSKVLGLSEGIETALAARSLTGLGYWPELSMMPVWACYAERNIRNFVIPDELLATLEKIVVFADHDKNGIGLTAACEFLAHTAINYPQLVVEIKVPPKVGDDWNDELVHCQKQVNDMWSAAADRAQDAIAAARAFLSRSAQDHPKQVLLVRGNPRAEQNWNVTLVEQLRYVTQVKAALADSHKIAIAI
jgi:putative DNA primase/helicase